MSGGAFDSSGGGRTAPRRVPTRASAALLLLLLPASGACWIEPAPSADGGEADTLSLEGSVREMMDAAADAWNRGDQAAFMSDYERSPETTYIGGIGLVRGWEGIRARYAPLFVPGAERDSLRFELLGTRELGPLHALALVRYVLYRSTPDSVVARDSLKAPDSVAAPDPPATPDSPATARRPVPPDSAAPDAGRQVVSTGLVTLVLLRVEGRWEIVHDHSSAEVLLDPQGVPADTAEGAAAEAAAGAGSR